MGWDCCRRCCCCTHSQIGLGQTPQPTHTHKNAHARIFGDERTNPDASVESRNERGHKTSTTRPTHKELPIDIRQNACQRFSTAKRQSHNPPPFPLRRTTNNLPLTSLKLLQVTITITFTHKRQRRTHRRLRIVSSRRPPAPTVVPRICTRPSQPWFPFPNIPNALVVVATKSGQRRNQGAEVSGVAGKAALRTGGCEPAGLVSRNCSTERSRFLPSTATVHCCPLGVRGGEHKTSCSTTLRIALVLDIVSRHSLGL